jgi:phospholipase/carboxylesterase
MSPSDAHVAPDEAQRPLWQLPEQQSPSPAQALPRVPHPPAATAAHDPLVQLLEQQSEAAAHFWPSGTQRVAPHFPPAHTLVQHSVGWVQLAPPPTHEGPATPQILDEGSQTPVQQLAPLAQVSPGALQLTAAPPLPPLPAPPVTCEPPEPAPPSPFDSAAEEFPQPAAAAQTMAIKSDERGASRSVMFVGAPRGPGRLTRRGSSSCGADNEHLCGGNVRAAFWSRRRRSRGLDPGAKLPPLLARPDSAASPSLSRRDALLVTLAASPLACRRPAPIVNARVTPPMAVAADAGAAAAWGGLQVVRVSGMRDDERGGTAVVVLHGWGAPGDDLVPLARELQRPGVRFFVPAAPLPEMGGGRAWWHLDPRTRPPHASTDEVAPGFRPTPAVLAAREAVQGLVATIVERHAPEAIALVGFSQGAMLSIDVALAGAPLVDRVVAMSGVLLVDSVPGLVASRPSSPRPRFLLSHGRQDPVVPFASGDRARALLEKRGFAVTWRPFDGGHEIPGPVVADVARFLFA